MRRFDFNEQFDANVKMSANDILNLLINDDELAENVIVEYLCRNDNVLKEVKAFINEV